MRPTVCLPISGAVLLNLVGAVALQLAMAMGATFCLPVPGAALLNLVGAIALQLAMVMGATFCLPVPGAALLILVGAVALWLTIALGATPFCRAGVLFGVCSAYGAENQHANQTCKCYS